MDIKISIERQQLADMPIGRFEGPIEVVDTPERLSRALSVIRRARLVGIDTETRPSFRAGEAHKVALLQIATLEKAWLVRLQLTGVSPALVKFLENEAIMKVGLSLSDDIMRLKASAAFEPRGFLDLQPWVKHYGIIDNSLQRIYAIIFGQRITKGQRLSNWEAHDLTEAQRRYAATDAWACLRIYEHLAQGHFNPETSPYRLPDEPPAY